MRLLWCILLLLLLTGCGYHLVGRGERIGINVSSVEVALPENRTYRADLEVGVHRELVIQLIAGGVPVVENGGEGVLNGTITRYDAAAVAYDAADRAVQYQSILAVNLLLRKTENGEILWKGEATRSVRYLSSDDRALLSSREDDAIRTLQQEVVQDLLLYLSEGM